jgi:hypothetical protein
MNSVHLPEASSMIWGGDYDHPLAASKRRFGQLFLDYNSVCTSDFLVARFTTAESSADLPSSVRQRVKKEFIQAALCYASTIFSYINSPASLFRNKKDLFEELRMVLWEIDKFTDVSVFTSSECEVLMACCLKIADIFASDVGCLEFRLDKARTYAHRVLSDPQAEKATVLLVKGRIAMSYTFSPQLREEAKATVLLYLEEVKKNPSSIKVLSQEWKTYVRLARMVYAWKLMFFGLRRDGSKDLWAKSLAFFVLNFRK